MCARTHYCRAQGAARSTARCGHRTDVRANVQAGGMAMRVVRRQTNGHRARWRRELAQHEQLQTSLPPSSSCSHPPRAHAAWCQSACACGSGAARRGAGAARARMSAQLHAAAAPLPPARCLARRGRARAPLRVHAARQGRGGRFPSTPHVEGHPLAVSRCDAHAAAAACDAWRGGAAGAAVLARWLAAPPGAADEHDVRHGGGASLHANAHAHTRSLAHRAHLSPARLHSRCAAVAVRCCCVPRREGAADHAAAGAGRRVRFGGGSCSAWGTLHGPRTVCHAVARAAAAPAPHALPPRRGARAPKHVMRACVRACVR